jgi:hypothetical protein
MCDICKAKLLATLSTKADANTSMPKSLAKEVALDYVTHAALVALHAQKEAEAEVGSCHKALNAAYVVNRFGDGPVLTLSERITHLIESWEGCRAKLRSRVSIAEMVNRFLAWKLPSDFAPDHGITYKPITEPWWGPTGTNLFNATQAKAMFEYCITPEEKG